MSTEEIAHASSKSLLTKVEDWLGKEGYPTEFETASIFHKEGFRVFQGEHVRPIEGGSPKEVDVIAWADLVGEKGTFLRCEFVVECKWSKDKPWVIFASRAGRMATSACIAQTISSVLGQAVCWHLAGDEECQSMLLFQAPERPGFGGRQAFTKGQDLFYSAFCSVTSAATHLTRRYDEGRPEGCMPRFCVLAFPVIVVEGELFEAFFSEDVGQMEVTSASAVRCHWRGAPTWKYHASVDVVTLGHLPTYLRQRRQEITRLLEHMKRAAGEIGSCFDVHSLEGLHVKTAPRGITGLPPLLRELRR